MKSVSLPATLAMLLICVFSWGSVFPIAKVILVQMHDLSLASWRFVIAAACLSLYLAITGTPWPKLTPSRYLVLALIGIIGVGGFNLALFTGLKQTSATNGALIMALSPLVTSLIAAIAFRRRPSASQWVSLAVGLAGVLLVITNGSLERLLHLTFSHGDLWVIAGMLAWSLYTVASHAVGHWLPALPFTLITMIGGGAALLLVCQLQADVHPVQELASLSLPSLAGVLYIGLFATVIGYLFWIQGVKTLGAAKASLFFNFVPVFAALVSLLLGQSLSGIQILGMSIVLAGLTAPALIGRLREQRQPSDSR